MLPGVLLRASDSHFFRALIPCLSAGASTVRDLWQCPADACNPLDLLSTGCTWKPRAPVWLSSPGMHFLTQDRAHQFRWLCLKAGVCYVRGRFLFPLHASQSTASFALHSHAAARGPAGQMISAWGRAATVQEVRQRPGTGQLRRVPS